MLNERAVCLKENSLDKNLNFSVRMMRKLKVSVSMWEKNLLSSQVGQEQEKLFNYYNWLLNWLKTTTTGA